jgi:hypothetical protein
MAIWAAVAAAVVGAAANAGVAYASQPNLPNAANSSRRTVLAALRTLPGQRMVDMAARLGTSVDFPTGKLRGIYTDKPIAQALADGDISQTTYNSYLAKGYITTKVLTGSTPETRHADFTGFGDADVQGKMADQMARIQLATQAKYGKGFLASEQALQAQADPEGTAARALLADEIQRTMAEREGTAHPVADTLAGQIQDELSRGREMTPDVARIVDQVKARRVAGGDAPTEDIALQLNSGPAGDARIQDRLQRALSHLTSGSTPEDIAYRTKQQDLANMAAFLGGRTPQSQFGALSGAQRGAAPVPQGPALIGPNPNTQSIGQAGALQNYTAAARNVAGQVSPWFAGLSAITRGAGVAGAAGWKPFGKN